MNAPKPAQPCLPECGWGPVGLLYFHDPKCPKAGTDNAQVDAPLQQAYIAPVSVPGSADQVWDKPPAPMCICGEPESPNVMHSTTGPCFRVDVPAPAPASDANLHEDHPVLRTEVGRSLVARIESEKAANAELRAAFVEIQSNFALCGTPGEIAGGVVRMLKQTLSHANEIRDLSARLAEVKAATRRVNMAAFDLYSDILPAVKALEAILAKGDK